MKFLLFALFFLTACTSATEDIVGKIVKCSTSTVESEMTEILNNFSTEVDFNFRVERSDGHVYNYNRGAMTPTTSIESASTSKLVTAVIILRLVDAGFLQLTSKPQDFISTWPLNSGNSLYNITLSHLLSFTSGLTTEPACTNVGISNFENCINTIATTNQSNTNIPGNDFYYSSTHLQVAGLMAIKAKGVANWQALFTEFKTQTGLFQNSTYDLPSTTNPRLAGGMHWTASDYFDFLRKLKDGTLLSASLQSQFMSPKTLSAQFLYTPLSTINEAWQYGFGSWHECQSTTFDCVGNLRISSPGAYGAYPYWDQSKSYFGLVTRQGDIGTFPNGLYIERAVRSKVETWLGCD